MFSGARGPTIRAKNQCKSIAGAHTLHHDGQPAAMLYWCSTRMVEGRHVSRCVLSRALAHLALSARAAHVAHLARLEHAAYLAHVEHVAHLAHQARLGP